MLTWEQIQPYLVLTTGALPRQEILHPYYHKSIQYKKKILSLFAETYPDWMALNRPRESKSHADYRKSIYENPVKGIESRIFGFVKSIPKSADYHVRFAEEDNTEDSFKSYVTEHFGIEGSLENWIWNDSIDLMKFDPNGVMVMIPEFSTNELIRNEVKGKFLGCEHVWQLQNGQFAVIESDEKFPLESEIFESQYTGKLIYFFDNESYTYAKQKSRVQTAGGNWLYTWEIGGLTEDELFGTTFSPMLHYCDGLPVKKVGRVLGEGMNSRKYEFYISELDPIIANIKKAIRRDSDHEVEVINSLSTLHWRMATKCKQCKGTGKVTTWDGEEKKVDQECNVCKGAGTTIPRTSLDVTTISTENIPDWSGDKMVNPVIPPGGSVQNTPVNLIAIRGEFEKEIENAFSGMGLGTFNYLALNQSGVAKKEDKEEGIRFAINMASHICKNLLEWAYWCTASIRYGISGNALSLMPSINVPTRFNLDSIDEVRNQLTEAIKNNMDSGVIDTYQLKLLKLEAGDSSLEYKRYHLRMLLDGYRGMNEEQKWFAISNLSSLGDRKSEGYIEAVKAYQFSINFDKIYQDAIMENEHFDELSLVEKNAKMELLAKKYETIKPANEEIIGIIQRSAVDIRGVKQVN